jgi:4-hydroxy-tetrahydrodipicolinate synthase
MTVPVSDYKGTWTALVTPFKPDGSVDYSGFEKNIQFQVSEGITGILPVGTTGESPALKEDEHNKVIKKAKEFSMDRCDVLAGAGSNTTVEALGDCRTAVEAGISKVLLVACYYNGPSSLELRKEYYQPILDEYGDIKIVIYVIPGRTGTAITPADIAVLSGQYDRVIAIKEATGDIGRMTEERSLMPDMSIMSGDDDITFEIMTNSGIRSAGVISVISNIAPGALTGMVDALLSGDQVKGKSLADKLKPLFSIVTVKVRATRIMPDGSKVTVEDRFRNPLAIKTAMNGLGIPAGAPRRPLGKMTPGGIEIVRGAIRKVYQESFDILKPLEDFYGIDIEERLSDNDVWNKMAYGA